MMKQPAENTNANPSEIQEAAKRVQPLPRHPDHDEIAEVAKELWRQRGNSGGSAEDDWHRACEIVRQRRAATSGATADYGNIQPQPESYGVSTSLPRMDLHTQEHYMQQETSGYTGAGISGAGNSGGVLNTVKDTVNSGVSSVRDSVSNLGQRVGEMVDTDPKSMPSMDHREGAVARALEQQTARIPSDAWLWAALGSMGLSLALELSGREKTANFVGHWVPTLLIFGLYNKMVKLQGSDGI